MTLHHFKIFTVCLITGLSSACTFEYGLDLTQQWVKRLEIGDQYTLYRQHPIILSSDIDICIAISSHRVNASSNRLLSVELNQALQPYVTSVEVMDDPRNKTNALKAAYRYSCDFLLYPQIVLSQNKISSFVEFDESDEEEIELGFDRQWLQLSLWDVNSGGLADLTLIKSRNGFFTLLPHQPEDLMQSTLASYANELFILKRY